MLLRTRTALIALALVTPGSAFAATTGTPDPFAAEVEQKCTAAASEAFRRPQVVVDPSGTESYGVAIVFGRSSEVKGRATVICVVDRKTGKAEIGGALGPDVIRVRGPKQQNDQGQQNGKRQKQNMMQNDSQGGKTNNNNNSSNSTGGQDDEDGSDDGQ